MGAWGVTIFEDDSALDFLDEQLLPHSDPRAVMRAAFESAIGADYLDYEAGHAVLVSAAAIQAAISGQPLVEDEPEDWAMWRKGLAELDFSQLCEIGSAACLRVCGGASELHELWAENEELFSAWKSGVETLAANLKRRA
jgi:hypothetical protein